MKRSLDFIKQAFPDSEIPALQERLAAGEPLAYLLGEIDFYGCKIEVNSDVLIPRLESEILVENILKEIDEEACGTLLDMCSGSGALGLSIKKHRPKLNVILSDISQKAIDVAKRNAVSNGLEVEFLKGDLFDALGGRKIDFLVCNPPYVTESEYDVLEKQVRDYEPKIALVGGDDGLLFYRRIAGELERVLVSRGKAFFEIGFSQGEQVALIFQKEGVFQGKVLKDFASHDRFFFLEKLS